MSDTARRIRVSVEREYAMDVAKIRRDFAAELAADVESGLSEEAALRNTFYELCGIERDRDHIDGSYVWQVGTEYADLDWNPS